jgi:beta-alanine degradation protein BauB
VTFLIVFQLRVVTGTPRRFSIVPVGRRCSDAESSLDDLVWTKNGQGSLSRAMRMIILMSLLSAMCMGAPAQDPVKTSPQYYKVLLENDQVRVLEYHLKAGEKEPMHSHPAGIVYVLSGATLKFSYPDGRTEAKTAATGETIWRDPVTHAVENTGKTEARAIAIDLKK